MGPRKSTTDRQQIESLIVKSVKKVFETPKFKGLLTKSARAIQRGLESLKETLPTPAVESKRGPGRPRKTTEETPVVAPKRGPGRPRKNPEAVVAATPTEVKRGPGRPRKNPEAVAAESAPKRGPGRPRKTETPTDSPKRGPGRPRKVESPKEEEAEEADGAAVLLMVRPKASIDWWPNGPDGLPAWATVDPAGGYVMSRELSYAFPADSVEEAKTEWLQDHEDRDWEFSVIGEPSAPVESIAS